MLEITLPVSPESIEPALNFVEAQLTDQSELSMYVRLALEELLVNVVKYSHDPSEVDAKFVVGCRWVNMDDKQQFCVTVKDWGTPFDPFRNVKKPDTTLGVEEREIGGLGVHLVKHISNHYIYSASDGSNTIELFFKS